MRIATVLCLAVGLMAFAAVESSGAAGNRLRVPIYWDAPKNGFVDATDGARADLASATQVRSGRRSIEIQFGAAGSFTLESPKVVTLPPDSELRFDLHAGANGRVLLDVALLDGALRPGPAVRVSVERGTWSAVRLPLADLGDPATVRGIRWTEAQGRAKQPAFLDHIRFLGPRGSGTPPTTTAPPTTTTAPPTTTPPPTTAPPPTTTPVDSGWAFEETFDGDPSSPSQDLLPRSFEYAATHRSHPGQHFTKTYTPFLADHGDDCAGPDPAVAPLPQHLVETRQDSTGSNPDDSFFICKNHMMSSMGDVEGYSVSAFWPRQTFEFSDGGVLEFDVNINDAHAVRSWWEVMLVPGDQLKIGAGPVDSPISETYPDDRIVLDFRRNVRTIKVGTGDLAPEGWLANETQRGRWDWAWWRDLHPDDPALDDRRIRRTMRMEFHTDRIDWSIETDDGTFDTWSVDVPGGLPFDDGLVLFKTHAYNPTKDGNVDTYTFHWDNIRFDGPVVAPYEVAEADGVVYLQRNGSRQIGETETVTIDLDAIGSDPVLFGQVHQPLRGQVLVSINGGPDVAIDPYEYEDGDCAAVNWKSFRVPLDRSQLVVGTNTFEWTIGPRPACADDRFWDGYSVKFLQIQTGMP